MSVTADDLYGIAENISAAPTHHKLLTIDSNPKLAKSAEYGYMTVGLMLSPHKASGANLCSWATAGCIAACLNTAGHGRFDATHVARIRKSKQFRSHRQWFMAKLAKEIRAAQRKAERLGLTLVVRLNVVSDIPWESVRFEYQGERVTIFDAFPDVQFYDYTKGAIRFKQTLPANYDLTMSDAGPENAPAVAFAQAHGARVARVYRNAAAPMAEARRWVLPGSDEDGTVIVDGDKHDLRFLDPRGVIVGLKAKGFARIDQSGFVKDILPLAA